MDDLVDVDQLIIKLIKDDIDIDVGWNTIKKQIEMSTSKSILLQGIDIAGILNELSKWFKSLMAKEPISKDVVALYFGLFETPDKKIQLYLIGSDEWDEEDHDWACDDTYSPEGRYGPTNLFGAINEIYFNDFDNGLVLILSLAALLLKKLVGENTLLFQCDNKALKVAFGFDDGDIYNI